jgi:uncharacterized repeat protein (TIGR02543 family)
VYTISYNLNGGTNSADNPDSYSAESTAITLYAATREGYAFGGWYTDIWLTIAVTGAAIEQDSTGNKTFYARWLQEYTITYNNVNGATNTNPIGYTIESTVTLSDLGAREGYTFGGWYTDEGLSAEVTGVAIAAGSTGNKTFYAKWTAAGSDGDNGGTVPDDITTYVLAGLCVVILFMAIHKVRKSNRTKKAAAAAEAQMYMQNPYGYNQYGQQQYGQNPYGQQQQNPYGQYNPYAQQQQNPYGQQQQYGQNPYGQQQQNPYNQNGKR